MFNIIILIKLCKILKVKVKIQFILVINLNLKIRIIKINKL